LRGEGKQRSEKKMGKIGKQISKKTNQTNKKFQRYKQGEIVY
jgi:hypothetical protein